MSIIATERERLKKLKKELEMIKERLNAKHPYDNANTCIKHLYQAEVQTILNAAEELARQSMLLKKMLVSLALCDHLGDVGGDVYKVLKELDIKISKDSDTWQENILVWAAENDITTLHGSKIER